MNRLNKIFCAFTMCFILFSCGTERVIESEAGSSSSLAGDSSFTVSVVPSVFEPLRFPITSQGKVQASRSINLSFSTSGRVSNVYVRNASYVSKGQLLAEIENQAEKLAVQEAQLKLKTAQSQFENELVSLGSGVKKHSNWDRIEEKMSLQTGVPQARIQLNLARHRLSQTYLYAPFAGIIDGWSLDPGTTVSALSNIGNLQDTGSFMVFTELLEFDIMKIRKGDSARITAMADPSNSFPAIVAAIDPRVKSNGYVTVGLALQQISSGIMEGMSVTVELRLPEEHTIVVPKISVVQKSGKPVIFTVEEQKAKWNYVTLGKENGTMVQVLEGIGEGDLVVVSNNFQLAHDSPLKIRKTQNNLN